MQNTSRKIKNKKKTLLFQNIHCVHLFAMYLK